MNPTRHTILVVDDEPLNLQVMEAMLIPLGYDVVLAKNGEECLDMIGQCDPDLILLDVMMPGLNGFEVAKRVKSDPDTSIIPIVMVTALREVSDRIKALESGADDFLTKPVDKTELRARVQSLLKVKAYNDHMRDYQKSLESEVALRTRELNKALDTIKTGSLDTIYRLSRAAVYKDEGTGSHIKRMAHYAAAISRAMGFDDAMVETVLYATPMHDVGKIGIPDRILLKPGKLDPDEWDIMKQHTVIGSKILEGSDAEFIKLGEVIALSHHERWDGSGYPKGLQGEAIPLIGRITALADVFDALTTERPYKKAFGIEKSFQIIREGTGSHFDPAVVDAFFGIEDELLDIRKRFPDDEGSFLFKMSGLF